MTEVRSSNLAPESFPFTVFVCRADNHEPVWGVTLLKPPKGEKVPVYIPPVASWEGCPMEVRFVSGDGESQIVGPPEP